MGRDDPALERARELELAVERAGRWSPLGPRCLTRAVALQRLLEDGGLEGARVRVGVQRDLNGFAAHAWVEFRGRVLGDSPAGVSRYRRLGDVDVFPRR